MVIRTVGGESVQEVCTQCKLPFGTAEGRIELFKAGEEITRTYKVAEFCSYECSLRYRGVNIFSGELDARLNALLKKGEKKNGKTSDNK